MPPPVKLSVIIPTYRYARFLPEAIESVLGQTRRDFELIVSDDASDDGSAEIIGRYARADARIRPHLHSKNWGMVAHWNWCLRQARGEYVKFVFGDDKLTSPSALATLVEMLDAQPRAVLAASARVILDEHSERVDIWDEMGQEGYHAGPATIERCFRRDRNLIGEPSAVMFRRAAARRGFDVTLRQLVDEEMWFHLLGQGGMTYTSDPICAFRRHGGQQTVVNLKLGIATLENLRLAGRYFDQYAAAAGLSADSVAFRLRVYRLLYYCRKDARMGEIGRAAAEILRPHLSGAWYPCCWALHRLARPFENAARSARKRWPALVLPSPVRKLA